jgi:hypothetical protein
MNNIGWIWSINCGSSGFNTFIRIRLILNFDFQ